MFSFIQVPARLMLMANPSMTMGVKDHLVCDLAVLRKRGLTGYPKISRNAPALAVPMCLAPDFLSEESFPPKDRK